MRDVWADLMTIQSGTGDIAMSPFLTPATSEKGDIVMSPVPD
jgi:hypothetical protein